jgi:hypothetical protein
LKIKKLYCRVELLNHHYLKENIPKGSFGYIIEIYEDDVCEVEFSNLNGITIGQLVLNFSEIHVVSY